MPPSDLHVLATSEVHLSCADSACRSNSRSDTDVPTLSVHVSTDCCQPPVSSTVSPYDGVTVAGTISGSLISSPCGSKLEDCSSGAGCEASNKTSSNTEVLPRDTVIAWLASYSVL